MRAPAHLHVAVRLLDRCGVDDAVVGDLLELYEARPSAVWLWREVLMAVFARAIRHVREDKPQGHPAHGDRGRCDLVPRLLTQRLLSRRHRQQRASGGCVGRLA